MSSATAQRDKFVRDLDTNIYKLLEAYRLLLRKGQVRDTANVHSHSLLLCYSVTLLLSYSLTLLLCHFVTLSLSLLLWKVRDTANVHEQLQVETASSNIVSSLSISLFSLSLFSLSIGLQILLTCSAQFSLSRSVTLFLFTRRFCASVHLCICASVLLPHLLTYYLLTCSPSHLLAYSHTTCSPAPSRAAAALARSTGADPRHPDADTATLCE
jgi:hypothetical protein